MKKDAYVKGFEEELEKVSAGTAPMSLLKKILIGSGIAAGAGGAGFGLSKLLPHLTKAHQTTQANVDKAKASAGKSWDKMDSETRAKYLSTFMGTGKGKSQYRKGLLSKV